MAGAPELASASLGFSMACELKHDEVLNLLTGRVAYYYLCFMSLVASSIPLVAVITAVVIVLIYS